MGLEWDFLATPGETLQACGHSCRDAIHAEARSAAGSLPPARVSPLEGPEPLQPLGSSSHGASAKPAGAQAASQVPEDRPGRPLTAPWDSEGPVLIPTDHAWDSWSPLPHLLEPAGALAKAARLC